MLGFSFCGLGASQDTFFLQGADSLGREDHGDFLAIDQESFLLEVWFEDAVRAAQRKTDIVAELLAFTGEFTSCCHSYTAFIKTTCTIVPQLPLVVKG